MRMGPLAPRARLRRARALATLQSDLRAFCWELGLVQPQTKGFKSRPLGTTPFFCPAPFFFPFLPLQSSKAEETAWCEEKNYSLEHKGNCRSRRAGTDGRRACETEIPVRKTLTRFGAAPIATPTAMLTSLQRARGAGQGATCHVAVTCVYIAPQLSRQVEQFNSNENECCFPRGLRARHASGCGMSLRALANLVPVPNRQQIQPSPTALSA